MQDVDSNLSMGGTDSESRAPQELPQILASLKNALRTSRNWSYAIPQLTTLLVSRLDKDTKRGFYDALNVVSFRAGRPGFSAAVAKPLFDAAYDKRDLLSPGYRKNVEDWKQAIDTLVSGKTVQRTDGRFGNAPARSSSAAGAYNDPESSGEEDGGASGLPDNAFSAYFNALMGHTSIARALGIEGPQRSRFSTSFTNPRSQQTRAPRSLPIPTVPESVPSYLLKLTPEAYPFSRFSQQPALLRPTKLQHGAISTPVTLHFTVSEQHLERTRTGQFKIGLCCFFQQENWFCTETPPSVSYFVNNEPVDLSRDEPNVNNSYLHGYDISKLCTVGVNALTILPEKCCCSYLFGVKLSEVTSLSALMRRVRFTSTLPFDTCHKRVFACLNADTDGGLESVSLQVSLRDPLLYKRISTPVRGKECTHVQCFDLEPYLMMNQKHPKFKCPLCSKPAPFSSLVVDTYFERVLQATSSSVEEVEVRPDASWCAVMERKRKASDETSGSCSEGSHSDDDSYTAPVRPLKKLHSLPKPASGPVFVDLTL